MDEYQIQDIRRTLFKAIKSAKAIASAEVEDQQLLMKHGQRPDTVLSKCALESIVTELGWAEDALTALFQEGVI